jgi:RNA repair, ligase-Pnkp-associating, region of Hen1
MLLTITTTYTPATDLGYLLHKNPASFQTVRLAFGEAHVFFPDAQAERIAFTEGVVVHTPADRDSFADDTGRDGVHIGTLGQVE